MIFICELYLSETGGDITSEIKIFINILLLFTIHQKKNKTNLIKHKQDLYGKKYKRLTKKIKKTNGDTCHVHRLKDSV